ncbi:MAG: phosphomethylpyrimidine synthase ThiC [bacterium]|nr:phosphomethylpyrimidine synthase ThiC [bacterium]
MTQVRIARQGRISLQMEAAAAREGVDAEIIRQGLAEGTIALPANENHVSLQPRAIGKGLKTKVNANIGTSIDYPRLEDELEKLRVALDAGVDAVMDLSTGGDIAGIRQAILEACPVPLGTVPIYQAAVETVAAGDTVADIDPELTFDVIERQAAEGVDFMTVHSGITMEVIMRLQREGRITDVVSRGGSFLVCWMLKNKEENPLYRHFDRLLEIAARYDVTLSLGDGLRPGCLADATDRAQIQELLILGELTDRAREAGVQVMIEGPGHVPLDQIEANMLLQKRLCHGAPFYVLGPLVTDVAPGYDHITSAIGGALAARAGADFLCYVTPAEHLGLPEADDVRQGIMAARIAGHAADIVKGVPGAREWDRRMAQARKALDWEAQMELAIDPARAREYHNRRAGKDPEVCSMCGDFCAMRVLSRQLEKERAGCSA